MATYLADIAENLCVDGPSARFTYRRMGTQRDTPLVLLHRFRGTIDWWDPEFLDYLAAEHDVIVFDNVGIGYSSGEPRNSVKGFAEGAIEFIEGLSLSTVDLLGWSLGGIVAQEVALRRPELVRKLVSTPEPSPSRSRTSSPRDCSIERHTSESSGPVSCPESVAAWVSRRGPIHPSLAA